MWSACRLPLQCSPSPSPAIRLNSLQYSELRDKLQAPIRTARNIVIQQSLSDRFAAAFLDQVHRNGIYSLPPGSPVGSSHFLFLHVKESGYKATMAEYQCYVCLLSCSLWRTVSGVCRRCHKWSYKRDVQNPKLLIMQSFSPPLLASLRFCFPSSLLLSVAPSSHLTPSPSLLPSFPSS